MSVLQNTTNLLLNLITTRKISYLEKIIKIHHRFINELELDENIISDIIKNIKIYLDDNITSLIHLY